MTKKQLINLGFLAPLISILWSICDDLGKHTSESSAKDYHPGLFQ